MHRFPKDDACPGVSVRYTDKNHNCLNPKYVYLSLDLLCFLVPPVLSAHPRVNFAGKWKYALPAVAIAGLIFIMWDAVFVNTGIRHFNMQYTIGGELFGVPAEDLLYYFCIPYACLFAYFALNQLIEKDHLFPHQELITSLLIVVLLIFGLYNIHRAYTGSIFLVTGVFLTLSLLKLRMRFMGRFYFAFAVLLIPLLAIDAFLAGTFTGEPVVRYDDAQVLSFRVASIPIEDMVAGLLLLLVCTTIFEKLEERFVS